MGTRRANGEGSIYFNSSRNSWEGQFRYYDEAEARPRKRKFTGKSKTEVAKLGKDFVKAIEKDNEALRFKKKHGKTVQEWLETWLEKFVLNKVKIKTYERYVCSTKCHIIPYIGNVNLLDLSTETIQNMLNQLIETGGKDADGLAPRTVNSVRRMLIGSLRKAVDLEIIKRNPALSTMVFKTNKPKIEILSYDEIDTVKFVAKNEGEVEYIVILLALTTGMRIGEIFGLHWADIDFDKDRLMVNQTLVSTNHGYLLQPTPKTKSSCRNIPLPQVTIKALKTYKQWQMKEQKLLLNKYVDEEIVIINQLGNYLDPSRFSYVTFKRILKKAGIKRNFRFHDLRHTHATFLLEKGINIKVVSERLGHSTIRITLDTYSHVVKSMQDDAVDVIQKIMQVS
jgi:integrase